MTFLRLFLFPVDLHFDRSRALFFRFWDGEVLLTLCFFAALIFALVRARKRMLPQAKFFIAWFFIELLPVSQIVSIGVQVGRISTAEHFLYVPSVGAFVVMALIFKKISQRLVQKGWLTVWGRRLVIVGLYSFFTLITIQQTFYSSNEIAMLERSLSFSPDNSRVASSLAFAYAKHRRFQEAEKYFRRALELEPWNVRERIGLGKALCDQGRLWEGLLEYDKIKEPGDFFEVLNENVLATSELLISKYQKWLSRNPQDPDAHYSLGVVLAKQGKREKAIEHFQEAIKYNPKHKNALFNLATTLEAMGRKEEALLYFEMTVNLDEKNPELDYYANKRLKELR